MTHPKSGERAIFLAYEDVHMLSHQIGTGRHVDLEALTQVRGELRALRSRYEETVRRTHLQMEDKARRIQVLQKRLSETEGLRARLDDAQARLRTLESGQELADLRQRVERLEPALADADHRHTQGPDTDPSVAGAVSWAGGANEGVGSRIGRAFPPLPGPWNR